MIKFFRQHIPEEIGVLVESDIPEMPGKFVLYRSSGQVRLIAWEEAEEDPEEFSTVSYGPLN